MLNSRKKHGFTLLEVLVVISIMTVMSIVIIANYRVYDRSNQLRESAQLVRSAIVEAQNMALAPKDQSPGVEYYYGVCIDANNMISGNPALDNHKKIDIYRFEYNPSTWASNHESDQVYHLIKSYDLPTPVKYLKTEGTDLYGWPPAYPINCAFFFKPLSNQTYYPNWAVKNGPPMSGFGDNAKFWLYLSLVNDETQQQKITLNPNSNQLVVNPTPPACFAADSKINVLTKNGSIVSKPITEISTGDKVESSDANGHIAFSEVWSVLDANEIKMAEVLNFEVKTKSGYNTSLSLAPDHFLYQAKSSELNNNNFTLKEAKDFRVGDKLFIRNPQNPISTADTFTEAEITTITLSQTRAMNILTMNDRVVVNDILASVYAQNPSVCAVATSGPKFLYKLIGPKVPNQMVNFGNKYIEEPVNELFK